MNSIQSRRLKQCVKQWRTRLCDFQNYDQKNSQGVRLHQTRQASGWLVIKSGTHLRRLRPPMRDDQKWLLFGPELDLTQNQEPKASEMSEIWVRVRRQQGKLLLLLLLCLLRGVHYLPTRLDSTRPRRWQPTFQCKLSIGANVNINISAYAQMEKEDVGQFWALLLFFLGC